MKKMIKFIISPWIILSILLISFLFFELTSIDIYIQDYFYNFNSKQWILDRNAVIPKLIFYDGIKIIFIVFVIAVLITVVFSRRITIIKHYQKGLMIVLLSCVLVPLFIKRGGGSGLAIMHLC
jgi:membrane-associated PAP2 superfamily phosphatase